MSRWTDDFKNHPFHNDWASLLTALNSEELPESTGVPEAQELARLRKVITYISGLLDGVDPELANPALLPNLHGNVQSALAEVRNFFSNGNIAHLKNANANADAIGLAVSQNALAPFGTAGEGLVSASSAYQETMTEYADKFSQRLLELSDTFAAKIVDLEGRIATANTGMAKLDSRIAAMEAQLPTQLSGYNTAFQASESQRAERYEKWTEGFQEKLDEQFAQAAGKHAAGLAVLNDYLDKAGKVLGSVVDTAQAGAYATYATEEKNNANTYRRLAIGMMVTAALVLFIPEIAHFVQTLSGYTVDWQRALYRLPFSLVLFFPALYLAKESSKHRVNEVSNRRRQHILTTIGPYLALLEPKKAEDIKAEVAKSIFSDNLTVPDDNAGDAGNFVAQVSNLLTTLLKAKR